jgi:hypothetical protein
LLSPAAQLGGFAKIALAQLFSFIFSKMNEAGFIFISCVCLLKPTLYMKPVTASVDNSVFGSKIDFRTGMYLDTI